MANQVQQEWEAWQAYTVGNRKDSGVSYLFVDTASGREFVSAHMGDGNHFIFRPGHPSVRGDQGESGSDQSKE